MESDEVLVAAAVGLDGRFRVYDPADFQGSGRLLDKAGRVLLAAHDDPGACNGRGDHEKDVLDGGSRDKELHPALLLARQSRHG